MADIDVPRNKGGDLKVNNPDDESINKWKELGVSKMDSESSGFEPETAPSGSAKVSKRRSRASKRTQTTCLTTDQTNFRQMVQQVTGTRFSNSQILKPEPQRPGNRLPAFDTSKFLLYQRQQNGMVGPNTSASGPMTGNVNQKVLCQVDGCNLDLSDCEAYYRRHRVCVLHSKSPQVTIHGQNQRFCQLCSRFHLLEEFDEEKRSCRRHLHGLKWGSKPRADSLLHSGMFFSSCQEKLDDIVELQRKVEKNWEAMDNMAKHCVKHCALYPEGYWINKSSLLSHWIKDHLVYSHDEGNFVLRSLTNAFLEEHYVGNHVRLNREILDILLNLLVPKMHPMFLKQGEFGKTESMKEEEWNAKEIYLMDKELYELPESPNCPSLIALYLQRNYDLTIFPPLFFDHMPVLQALDLSHTSIKSLSESLPKLVALRKLILRGCQLFMELSPQVGELDNLEELDLEETQIICLPVEIGKLVKLKRLRASFYGDMNCSKKRLQSSTMIHTGVISNLFHLIELSIDVNPDDERWNATVEAIIEEVCSSKMLNTLSLYLPKFELLKKLGSTSLIYHPLSRFSFVVGHPKRRIISRVPDEVEARFKECDKCLKFVNGRDIPDEIKEVLRHATAFYLEHNATAVNLSEFGIENMKKLKFCILAECNKMQTIIDGGELYEERSDTEEEEKEEDQTEEVLGSLLYLGIYYMNNLRSISKGPIHKGCLLNLKLLRIHTCPKLSTIFSVDFLANLNNLEVLIIEDCPQVTCIVSQAPSHPASVNYLPSLRRILLLFLPELVSISSGLHIAPKLERIGFYYCPKLESLSTTELSSENLKVIKGERKWWDEALKWNESDWGCQPDHLNDIFFEIDEEKDLVTQLTEDGYFGESVEDGYFGELVEDGYFGEPVEDGFFFHDSEQIGVEGSGGWQRPGVHEDARKMNLEKFLMGRKSRVSSLAVTSDQVKASPMEQLPLLNL